MSAVKEHGHAHRNVSVCSSYCLFGTLYCTALGHIGGSAPLGLLLQLEYPRLEGVKLLPGMRGSTMSSACYRPVTMGAHQLSGSRTWLLCSFTSDETCSHQCAGEK